MFCFSELATRATAGVVTICVTIGVTIGVTICTPGYAQEKIRAITSPSDVKIFVEKRFHDKRSQDKSQQGMALSGKYFFCLEDGGTVNVYPFEKGVFNPVGSFSLASSGKDNHANNAEFGVETKKGASFPLMYVSVGKPGSAIDWTCFVESITKSGDVWTSELVQRIILDKCKGWKEAGYTPVFGAPSWLVDTRRKSLWVFSAIQRTTPSVTKRNEDNLYIATMFRIPALSEGDTVFLGVKDIIKQVTLPYDVGFTQAGCVDDGIIYYCFGVGGRSKDRPAAIRAYDTDSGTVLKRYDIFDQVLQEPEDLVLKGGWLYLNANADKGFTPYIYKIKK